MPSKLLRTGLVTAVLAVAPTYLAAQEAAPAAAPAPAAEAPAAPAVPLTELQQLQQRLAALQQQANQDAAVQAAFAAVNEAMAAADPEFKTLSERAQAIPAEVEAARAASDNAKLNQLAAEVNALNTSLAAARQRASANADVQAKTTAYRTALLTKMVELEPNTQQLIARLGELSRPAGQ